MFAQDMTDQMTSQEALNTLKNGVLVIRLDMQKNKIEHLKEKIANESLDSTSLANYKTKLVKLTDERARYKQNFIKSFDVYYNFSEVCFIESQDFKIFQEGDFSYCTDDQITSLEDSNYLVLLKGSRDSHWIIRDRDLKPIKGRFPDEIKRAIAPWHAFSLVFEEYNLNRFNKMAEKLNEKFLVYELENKKEE